MSEKKSLIEESINFWNGESFEKYKEWLETRIKLNDNTSIFLFEHIENFLKIYTSKLGMNSYPFKEKLFYLCIELKRLEKAKKLLSELRNEFGKDPKIFRLISATSEIDPKSSMEKALERYKVLMLQNQGDSNSIKQYILAMKFITKLDTAPNYINLWNSYLKNHMDDQEAWGEIGDMYLVCNNYEKAFYCFEEILLHSPYNYKILNKLGDIQASLDTLEGCKIAITFYCRSLNCYVNNRAVWGICFCLDYILEKEKKLDNKMTKVGKLVKILYGNLYAKSNYKTNLDDLFNFSKVVGK